MSLEDMLLKFNIMFSWECRGNLRSILPQVVNICTDVDHRYVFIIYYCEKNLLSLIILFI